MMFSTSCQKCASDFPVTLVCEGWILHAILFMVLVSFLKAPRYETSSITHSWKNTHTRYTINNKAILTLIALGDFSYQMRSRFVIAVNTLGSCSSIGQPISCGIGVNWVGLLGKEYSQFPRPSFLLTLWYRTAIPKPAAFSSSLFCSMFWMEFVAPKSLRFTSSGS